MQRPGGAGTPQGAGGTVTGHQIGGRNPVEVRLVAIFLLCAGPTVRLSAQVPDTTPPPLVTTGALVVGTDTTHRIRPIGAFLRSLLVPGWGQAATGRHVTGALFATWEGVAAMMTLKAQSEMHYLQDTHSANPGAKRQEVRDWLLLWVFNHLCPGAQALEFLRERSPVRLVGVIEPGARAAVQGTRSGRIGVIGTAGTIASGAYERAIKQLRPDAAVCVQAYPLFVPLVEEGWFDHSATELIAREYLAPLERAGVDVLVLGCTHYPLMKPLLARVLGPEVTLVDSAEETAKVVA